MARGDVGSSSTEWVTLVSQDGYSFIMDKRHARRSMFIRSMLGEGGSSKAATVGGGGGKKGKGALRAQEKAQSSDNGGDDAHSAAAVLDEFATPPPPEQEEEEDVDGYANPFSSSRASATAAKGDAEGQEENDFASGFAEARSNVVRLPRIRGVILEKVVEYLCWEAKYHNAKDGVEIPKFEHRIPPEIALELLMAADFLMENRDLYNVSS